MTRGENAVRDFARQRLARIGLSLDVGGAYRPERRALWQIAIDDAGIRLADAGSALKRGYKRALGAARSFDRALFSDEAVDRKVIRPVLLIGIAYLALLLLSLMFHRSA